MNENGIMAFKLSEMSYDSIKHYKDNSVLSVELDILSTKYGELIIKDNNIIADMTIICHDIIDYTNDAGIVTLFEYNNHRWLKYFKNDQIETISGSFDIIREYEALPNKNIGIKCFISGYSEEGNYDVRFNDVMFTELKKDPIRHIYTAPTFGNENVEEETYAILKYRNKFGVVINSVYNNKNDDNKYSSDHWYEWIEFPK